MQRGGRLRPSLLTCRQSHMARRFAGSRGVLRDLVSAPARTGGALPNEGRGKSLSHRGASTVPPGTSRLALYLPPVATDHVAKRGCHEDAKTGALGEACARPGKAGVVLARRPRLPPRATPPGGRSRGNPR